MRHSVPMAVFSLSVCAALALFPRCSGNSPLAGGVETTNGLTVVASGMTVRGSAPAGSTVSIFSESFNPTEKNSRLFTDSESVDSGKTFSFIPIRDSGSYNIVAINAMTHRGAMIPSFPVRPGVRDSIFIPFRLLGEIRGLLFYVKNSDTIALGSFGVYCKGSNFSTQSDSSGYYTISTIPLGPYRVALVPKAWGAVAPIFDTEIEQTAELDTSNRTVTLDFLVR
jgi:hypothetical protein